MTPKDKVVIPEEAGLTGTEIADAMQAIDLDEERKYVCSDGEIIHTLNCQPVIDAQLLKLLAMGYKSPEEIKEIEKRAREELIKEIDGELIKLWSTTSDNFYAFGRKVFDWWQAPKSGSS